MVATAPTKPPAAMRARRDADAAPDLAHFRRRYPETVANFGTLPRREEWLRRIWHAEARWREAAETRGGEPAREEAFVRGAPPAHAGEAEAEFDVIYSGGPVALLHAAALACGHGRRALVICPETFGRSSAGWNLSDEDVRGLEASKLFTREEVEASVVNRYRGGFVKFHDAGSRVKAEPLWVTGTLDVALDAARLLALAAQRLQRREGCAVVEGLRFVRAYVEASRVTVEAEGPGGIRRFFAARLFVDAGGADSPVARQLNGGPHAHVCPSVGTVARGFVRGEGRGAADFQTGEILVSTEDARDHRQLFWEGFAGSPASGDYSTRLFFFDSADSPADKSLLALFERYFESLPAYKRRGAGWKVERPFFGYEPVARRGRRGRFRTSDDRVVSLGGAGTLGSRAAGPRLRALRRAAHLTHLALEANLLDAESLARISDGGPRVAEAVGLEEFMRPAPRSAPQSVNETLNALTAALGGLDERVRSELFQGRLSLAALRELVGRTARLYPRIFERVRERFGARGTFWWLAGIAEAVWSERRGGVPREGGAPAASEDPKEEFARVAAAYGEGRGVS